MTARRCLKARVVYRTGVFAMAFAAPFLAASANADEGAAAEFFRAGKSAYAKGELHAAALAFEAAYREQPHGAALFNAAQSWLGANVLPRAADDYAEALRAGGLDPAQDAESNKRLAELRASLGWVTVSAPSSMLVSVGHVQRATAPLTVHLVPGGYDVQAVGPDGAKTIRKVQIAAGAATSLTLEPGPIAAPPAGPAPAAPPAASWRPSIAIGSAMIGMAVGAGASALVIGSHALNARDTFEASGFTDRTARAQAVSLQAWANGMLVGAGVLSVAGVVVLVASSRSTASAALRFSPGQVMLSGQF